MLDRFHNRDNLYSLLMYPISLGELITAHPQISVHVWNTAALGSDLKLVDFTSSRHPTVREELNYMNLPEASFTNMI